MEAGPACSCSRVDSQLPRIQLPSSERIAVGNCGFGSWEFIQGIMLGRRPGRSGPDDEPGWRRGRCHSFSLGSCRDRRSILNRKIAAITPTSATNSGKNSNSSTLPLYGFPSEPSGTNQLPVSNSHKEDAEFQRRETLGSGGTLRLHAWRDARATRAAPSARLCPSPLSALSFAHALRDL